MKSPFSFGLLGLNDHSTAVSFTVDIKTFWKRKNMHAHIVSLVYCLCCTETDNRGWRSILQYDSTPLKQLHAHLIWGRPKEALFPPQTQFFRRSQLVNQKDIKGKKEGEKEEDKHKSKQEASLIFNSPKKPNLPYQGIACATRVPKKHLWACLGPYPPHYLQFGEGTLGAPLNPL